MTDWRFIAFADLHVSERTLDRTIEVLRRVRMAAKHYEARVVFLGDFWDRRGFLSVRQLDVVLEELHVWEREGVHGIFIPGNHDQVGSEGTVHGLQPFAPFKNIMVATERIVVTEPRIAFLPWRDDPQDQAEQFATLGAPGDDWTIFGHAEVGGALANNGHPAHGRVTLTQIQSVARACYLGHYHARQKLGDRTWYIGSPYEQNMGERDRSHGIALITPDRVEPEWIDFADFPRHFRIDLRRAAPMPPLRSIDIVEILGTKPQFGDPAVKAWIAGLPAQDARTFVVADDVDDIGTPPAALGIHDAVRTYAKDEPNADALVAFADSILAETRTTAKADPIGTVARPVYVRGSDFMALRGPFEMDLAKRGVVHIQGPQGVGKTSLVDSITWCTYGLTSPRKVGNDAASIRGDEVIHDDAASCRVTLTVEVDVEGSIETYEITREKKRGEGAKVRIKRPAGAPKPALDAQGMIHAILGLDYPLWRACVSLGQGAVANFVTDGDKARKALFLSAFGLDVCAEAQKLTRARAATGEKHRIEVEKRHASIESVLAHLETQSFAAEHAKWESERDAKMMRARAALDAVHEEIAEYDKHLDKRKAWFAQHDQYEDRVILLERRLQEESTPDKKHAKMQRDLGAAHAERSVAERDLARRKAEYTKLVGQVQGADGGRCSRCNQALPRAQVDEQIVRLEQSIHAVERDIDVFTQRIANIAMELEGLTGAGAPERAQLEKDLRSARSHLQKSSEAINALKAIEMKREMATDRIALLETQIEDLRTSENPWSEKLREQDATIRLKREQLETINVELKRIADERAVIDFWINGFGPKGLPVLVLRTALDELEQRANEYLSRLTEGLIYADLSLDDDSLDVRLKKLDVATGTWNPRRYEQLSGGERRCVELAFAPFGLSAMLFGRLKCKVPFMIIDELTTHLGQKQKTIAIDILHSLDRDTVLVVDHDLIVEGSVDVTHRMEAS